MNEQRPDVIVNLADPAPASPPAGLAAAMGIALPIW